MSVTAHLRAAIDFSQSGPGDIGSQRFQGLIQRAISLSDGITAGKANILFADERSVAASSNDDLDLAGSLSNAFGAVITAAKVVAILLVNKPFDDSDPVNLSSLTMGGGTNPVAGLSAPPVGPGGFIFMGDPDVGGLATVTAATGDILRIANGAGGTAVYQIVILARTA